MITDLDPCIGPIGFVCDLASTAAGAVQSAAVDYALGGLGAAFVAAAASVGDLALEALDAATTPDLTVGWVRDNAGLLTAITLPILVGTFVAQVVGSVLRREPGGLARALVGVGKATLGAALAVACTQLALTATDALCAVIADSAGTTVSGAASRFFEFGLLATALSPALQLLVGGALVIGFLLLWGVLLFRKAALIVMVVFAPIAFAGAAWDQTRVWTRRWLEVVAALVFSKLVIVTTFVVGAAAFTSSAGTTETTALSDALVGALLVAIAVFAPWLTWRFVHWSGMEAAAVMHQTMAANPVSNAAASAGRTAKIATQQAAITAVTAGAGSALSGARAGAGAAGGAARAATTRPPTGMGGAR